MLVVIAIVLLLFVLPPAIGIALLLAALAFEVLELVFWRRLLRRYRVVTGSEGLRGERAEVIEACDPEGWVRLRGENWKARSREPLRVGERVVVAAVDGLTLEVERDG
jgi:membrane protein implicated in regulation of membrane protease activity